MKELQSVNLLNFILNLLIFVKELLLQSSHTFVDALNFFRSHWVGRVYQVFGQMLRQYLGARRQGREIPDQVLWKRTMSSMDATRVS